MSKKIMVIDDEDIFREPLIKILNMKGFEAIGFSEGNQALDWIKAGNTFDLLLLDLNNSLGMDGFQFLTEMKNNNLDEEVYLISGDDSPKVQSLLTEHQNISKKFIKPFPVKEMIDEIVSETEDLKMAA